MLLRQGWAGPAVVDTDVSDIMQNPDRQGPGHPRSLLFQGEEGVGRESKQVAVCAWDLEGSAANGDRAMELSWRRPGQP